MRALVAGKVGEPTDVLRLESRPVPTPEAGQALVRVKATPIHASDLHVLRGRYGFSLEIPAVGGHIPQGQPFPLERFAEAIALAETPAHDAKPLFVFEDGRDRDDR
ncbi:hypothetical protein [Streptomyces decoyicus]|uniref:hypothetical protein n=1 Tax=Streptomyces decoyicus TaxID=249567 RepID=UPI00386BF082|nr:hypothetical protein OG532_39065 [Streptomyces decoyicus]